MESSSPYEFPHRPFSINEALNLRNKVELFVHTDPLIGLETEHAGQATGKKSVIGIWIGIGSGAHLFGFDPEAEEWESVSLVSVRELPDPTSIQRGMSELVEWLEAKHPGEKLTLYSRENFLSN
jgi:hypothetical protein